MTAVLNTEVLFPVYRVLKGPGSNALYDIIGWVGFVPTSFNPSGSSGTITGYFKEYIADGIRIRVAETEYLDDEVDPTR